nr:MAG TPA: hypothetical protein [Caudoviricetes sp.]
MTIKNIRKALAKTYESWELQATTYRKYNVNHNFFDDMFSTMTFIGQLLIASGEFDNTIFNELYAEAKAEKERMNAIVRGEIEA